MMMMIIIIIIIIIAFIQLTSLLLLSLTSLEFNNKYQIHLNLLSLWPSISVPTQFLKIYQTMSNLTSSALFWRRP